MLPMYLDTDHHIIEPPGFWTGRFSTQFADRAPVFVRHPKLGSGWSWDNGKTLRAMGLQSSSSEDPRKLHDVKQIEEIDPGCYDPRKRIEVMDVDGAQACLLFPASIPPAFYASLQDDAFYAECARVYNDAVMDWAVAGDASRILPAAYIPMCDLPSAAAEQRRAVDMGFKHYLFNMYPSGSPVPTPADDPFWAQVQETGMTVSMHGFRGGHRPSKTATAPLVWSGPGKPSQEMTAAGRGAGLGSTAPLVGFVLSGVMERFPGLKMALIETSTGWLPYLAERMDALYTQHRWLADRKLQRLPSEYLLQLYANFDREWLGVKHRQAHVGSDRLLFGTDYPHIGSFYPHTRFYIELVLQGVPAAEQEKILWSNGARLYGLN
ncbi:MAG: amidohydrolase [Dehalococcoidia bacterium]|nr:amidohydrolase [Dehalococcoidia bacterium]